MVQATSATTPMTPTRTDEPVSREARALSDLYDALSFMMCRLKLAGYDHQRDADIMNCAEYALRQAETLAGESLFLGGPDEEMAVYDVEVTQTVSVEVPKTRFDLAQRVAIMQAQTGHWKTTVFNDNRSLLAKDAHRVEPLGVELMRYGRGITDRLRRRVPENVEVDHTPPVV